MKNFNIAVIPGDGIGEEVTFEAVRVLDAAAEVTGSFRIENRYFLWGCKYYLEHGRMMDKKALNLLKDFDAIYFGAVGFPSVPDHISLRGLRLPICRGFEQYVCLRPSELLKGTKGALAGKNAGDINFVVVRENTEGEYTGAGGRSHEGMPAETAVETSVFTRRGVERIMRYAFSLAQSRKGRVTSATKSNAQQHTMTFWDEIFSEIAVEFPAVKTERVLIDALAARFVLNPESLDVVVASNLFGDILTDLGAAITGGLGIAPSGNINPDRKYPSMFEPVHGSAPDITGKGIANPIGMIRSGAMMLDFLGEKEAAELIENSVRQIIADGKTLTPELGGNSKTSEVTEAIISYIKN